MRVSTEHKKLLTVFAIGILSTVIGGVVVARYEHTFLTSSASPVSPTRTLTPQRESRTIKVTPVSKWSQSVLFNPRRYYKMFQIRLYGGDIGFPPNTAIQVSASTGTIINVRGPEAIKPTFAGRISAVDWTDKKYQESTKTVFVTGPNARIEARLHVVIISKGKDIPDDGLKLIVSPPGALPVEVDYEKDVKWSSNK